MLSRIDIWLPFRTRADNPGGIAKSNYKVRDITNDGSAGADNTVAANRDAI